MIERRNRPCFPLEPIARRTIGRCLRRQHLDGYGSVQPRVARPVDVTHASLTDALGQYVRSNLPPGEVRTRALRKQSCGWSFEEVGRAIV